MFLFPIEKKEEMWLVDRKALLVENMYLMSLYPECTVSLFNCQLWPPVATAETFLKPWDVPSDGLSYMPNGAQAFSLPFFSLPQSHNYFADQWIQ